MPGGGSQQTSSQTTSSGPWKPSQGYLKGAMGQASELLNDKAGFKPFPGQGYVPFSDQSKAGLGQMQSMASGSNPFYSGAKNFTNSLISGGENLDQSGFRGMLGRSDADFNNVVQNTVNDVGDQIQRQFGGASYGAGANADYLTKGVGDVASKMRSDNFYNQQNLQRGLLGDIANLEQGDIANRMGGLGMMDQVYNSQYLPAERMMQVGGAYEGKAGEKLQAQMDKFNIKQMSPWDRLAQAYGIYSGTGQQGNRTQTSVSQPTDPWSKILGGGLLGSQLLGF